MIPTDTQPRCVNGHDVTSLAQDLYETDKPTPEQFEWAKEVCRKYDLLIGPPSQGA